jgi:hypothetical protein
VATARTARCQSSAAEIDAVASSLLLNEGTIRGPSGRLAAGATIRRDQQEDAACVEGAILKGSQRFDRTASGHIQRLEVLRATPIHGELRAEQVDDPVVAYARLPAWRG